MPLWWLSLWEDVQMNMVIVHIWISGHHSLSRKLSLRLQSDQTIKRLSSSSSLSFLLSVGFIVQKLTQSRYKSWKMSVQSRLRPDSMGWGSEEQQQYKEEWRSFLMWRLVGRLWTHFHSGGRDLCLHTQTSRHLHNNTHTHTHWLNINLFLFSSHR